MRLAAALGLVLMLGSTGADAHAMKCDIVGSWTDSYNATITFTTEKKGTANAAVICASGTYKIRVTHLTRKVFKSKSTTKNNVCPMLSASLTFQGGCTSATGTITVSGEGQYDDTWTKTGDLRVRAAMPDSRLSDGLR